MGSVKYHLLLCFSFLVSFSLFSQKTYQFRLIDQVSKQPVPYATVGLVQQNTGASTDSEGMLSLKGVVNSADSVIVSCLGYEPLRFPLSVLSIDKSNVLELKPIQYALQGITIKPEKLSQPIVLNKIDRKKYKFGRLGGNYSSQIARKFTVPSDPENKYLLKSVSYFMKNSPGDQISNFRVRIYQIDPLTGGPGADLLTSPIIRTVTKKDEVITIDLQPYQILVDSSSFFVALEWLKTDANMMMMTVKGQKKAPAYLPPLGIRYIDENFDLAWDLTYKNTWAPLFSNFSRDLAISAEVVPIHK